MKFSTVGMFLFVVSISAFLGCNESGESSGIEDDRGGKDCTTDLDCDTEIELCNPVTGQCEPRQTCGIDQLCPAGQVCDPIAGLCMNDLVTGTACTTQDDCAADEYCNELLGVCEKWDTTDDDDDDDSALDDSTLCKPCIRDTDCGGNDLYSCVEDDLGNRYCTRECSITQPCPNDYVCSRGDEGKELCQPPDGYCNGSTDDDDNDDNDDNDDSSDDDDDDDNDTQESCVTAGCEEPLVCDTEDGDCKVKCLVDGCPIGYECNEETGDCDPASSGTGGLCDPCEQDEDCLPGGMCIQDLTGSKFCGTDCTQAQCTVSNTYCNWIDDENRQCWPTTNRCGEVVVDCNTEGCPAQHTCNTSTGLCEYTGGSTSGCSGACDPATTEWYCTPDNPDVLCYCDEYTSEYAVLHCPTGCIQAGYDYFVECANHGDGASCYCDYSGDDDDDDDTTSMECQGICWDRYENFCMTDPNKVCFCDEDYYSYTILDCPTICADAGFDSFVECGEGSGGYDLCICSGGSTSGSCPDHNVIPITSNNYSHTGNTTNGVSVIDETCTDWSGFCMGKEIVYSIELTAGQTVNITADSESGWMDMETFDIVLTIRNACRDADTTICYGMDEEFIEGFETISGWTAPMNGTYFIVVDGRSYFEEGEYDISVNVY